MAFVFPDPARPAAAAARDAHSRAAAQTHARAHGRWRAGQDHVRREQWPLAAQAFEQASALHDDSAYALAAAHALIKAGRSTDAVRCARRVRETQPHAGLAYTLESHALLALGRAEEAVTCLRALPADVPRDHDHQVSLAVALQRCHRHAEAIRAFFDALGPWSAEQNSEIVDGDRVIRATTRIERDLFAADYCERRGVDYQCRISLRTGEFGQP